MAQASATLDATETAEAELKGFRSARFGMDEEAVLEAIKADFGLEGEAVNIGSNTVERTRVITISVPDILPDGGTAQVSYIFGYKSKTLIQVGILWSAATDETITDATLYANGDLLRSYLASAGYRSDTITRDVVLDNGVLLFRGSDASGHTAILLLQGRFEGDDSNLTLLPEALTLLYAVNPDDPDILTISPGDF
ncbi:hypothetical protein [Maritimibacter sp. HL-12]|uniref:hypothetical protein n=1 Tax=Maritimibacter sp. HL-12 TaxID=1162418 RepID=UPI00111C0115|nr:hypothetical protein [Maritimibacter sp. HL-12]